MHVARAAFDRSRGYGIPRFMPLSVVIGGCCQARLIHLVFLGLAAALFCYRRLICLTT